jgi:hypothetical protein
MAKLQLRINAGVLYRVTTNRAVCGVIVLKGVVVDVCPYLRAQLLGRDIREFQQICKRKRWKVEKLG